MKSITTNSKILNTLFFFYKKQMSLWIISPVYALLIEYEIH